MKNLSIVIPTFNRAAQLYRTLCALLASPFSACRLTILDNASTDDTPGVCRFFAGRLNLVYIRNSENIGAERNYCRAVQVGTAPSPLVGEGWGEGYVWILGDDDQYIWEFGRPVCQDLLDAIIAGEVDLILPGVALLGPTIHGRHNLGDLINGIPSPSGRGKGEGPVSRSALVYPLSFVPSLIFKRRLYTPELLAKAEALAAAGNLLPMLPFVDAMAARNASVWISETCHIDKGLRHGYSSLHALRDWLGLAQQLAIGPAMLREMFAWPRCLSTVIGSIVCDPPAGRAQRFHRLTQERASLKLFWPVALLPDFLLRAVRGLLTLSQYDGDRGKESGVTSCPVRVGPPSAQDSPKALECGDSAPLSLSNQTPK